MGSVDKVDFRLVEHRLSLRCPSPHTVLVAVLVAHGGVAGKEYDGFAVAAVNLPAVKRHVLHHRLQWI